jgi:hypothetical protein
MKNFKFIITDLEYCKSKGYSWDANFLIFKNGSWKDTGICAHAENWATMPNIETEFNDFEDCPFWGEYAFRAAINRKIV